MKTILIILISGLLLFSFNNLTKKELTWETNFAEAAKKAKKEKKKLLVNFTGSDWCGWCIKLDKEVFSKEKFVEYANKNLVCVKLDFPKRKEIAPEIKEQNNGLAQKYGVRGFPTIYILEADEDVILKTGYMAGGEENYITHIAEAIKAKK